MNMDRWKPGGDKYESIKADEALEKAEAEYFSCDRCDQHKEIVDICVSDKNGDLLCFDCFDIEQKGETQ